MSDAKRDAAAEEYVGGPANNPYKAAQNGFRDGWDECTDHHVELLKAWGEITTRLTRERDEARAENELLMSMDYWAKRGKDAEAERDRYRTLLEWLSAGIEHFTADEDRAQVVHLRKAIAEALRAPDAQSISGSET